MAKYERIRFEDMWVLMADSYLYVLQELAYAEGGRIRRRDLERYVSANHSRRVMRWMERMGLVYRVVREGRGYQDPATRWQLTGHGREVWGKVLELSQLVSSGSRSFVENQRGVLIPEVFLGSSRSGMGRPRRVVTEADGIGTGVGRRIGGQAGTRHKASARHGGAWLFPELGMVGDGDGVADLTLPE